MSAATTYYKSDKAITQMNAYAANMVQFVMKACGSEMTAAGIQAIINDQYKVNSNDYKLRAKAFGEHMAFVPATEEAMIASRPLVVKRKAEEELIFNGPPKKIVKIVHVTTEKPKPMSKPKSKTPVAPAPAAPESEYESDASDEDYQYCDKCGDDCYGDATMCDTCVSYTVDDFIVDDTDEE